EKTGLSKEEINDALSNDEYAYMVQQDIMESRNIGVRGVPFFVFNRKYGISGAQPVEVFTNTIEKSYTEWRKDNEVITLEINEGPACTTDGVCD
ncbi:MAG TPA: DsbA family protein, partial [Niabella sp.]|nr:DsbA family protein [Niabella sp.]